MSIKYLPAVKSNLSDIVKLDVLCYDHPLDEEIIYDCIQLKQMILAFDGKRVVGYICYQSIPNGKLILGLAVHPSVRRRGVGTQLVDFVRDLENTQKIEVEVRENNLVGQLFLKSIGFNCFEILKEHYEESTEWCYVFTYYVGVEV